MTARVLTRLLHAIDADRAVLWGLSGRLWVGLAGPVTALLIAWSFTPELQGYHYTFLTLLSLQLLVELGLSNVISIFASHEWARLGFDGAGRIEGDAAAQSRLASILRFGLRWFGIGAVVLAGALTLAGLLFFSVSREHASAVTWSGPWVALCLATALSVALAPAWAILQGCNQVGQINFYRLIESALRSVALWIALLSGVGLWSAALASFAVVPWALGFLWVRYRHFFGSLLRRTPSADIEWKRDILPLQWRIAISWLAGYFSFSLFTPALFWFHGPVVAGQMGMTWALISGISGLAGTWTQVKAPSFAMLVARSDFHTLDRLVRRAGGISFAVACAGSVLLIGLLAALEQYAPDLRARLLPTLPIVAFVAAEALKQISAAQSSYLRAFKREPFMVLSLTTGVTVAISTIVCSKYFGPLGIAAGYLTVIILTLVWGSNIVSQWRHHLRTS